MQDVQVDLILIVGLECNTIPEQLLREIFRLELVPFIGGRSPCFVLLEALSVELLALILPCICENALKSLNAERFTVRSRALILNELLELVVRLHFCLLLEFIDVLVKVFLSGRSLKGHHILLHAQLFEVPLDIRDRLFIGSQLDFFLAIVVTKVPRIENIVLNRVVMVGQGLHVMRPNEPLSVILVRQRILDRLQVVIGRQIQIVRRRDVVVH